MMGISLADLSPKAQAQVLAKLKGRQAIKKLQAESKYHAQKTDRMMPGGKSRTFDSLREARRYDELLQLLRSGAISDLRLQPQFTLQDSYITAEGERVRAIRYVADFSYVKDGARIVEDAKGMRTEKYKLKKKLLNERFGITIREV